MVYFRITMKCFDNIYAKLQSKTEKINNISYSTSYTYNKYDDLLSTTYPSGIVISNEYDVNGYVTNIKNGTTTLFTNQGMTSYGNYKTYQYGNGLINDVSYHFTYPTRYYSRNTTATIKRQDLNLVWNYGTGNLTSRNDAIVSRTESFVYDIMNRLTSARVGTNTALTSNYSVDGNITVKSDAAGVGGLEYLNSKINAVSKISTPINISLSTQNITYSVYQRPTNINESSKSLDLAYSFDYERRMATFKTNNVVDETRIYVGNYEKQTIGSTTREIHYVSNGERLIAIIVKEGTTTTNYYTHTDHLGSILAITNSSMNYVAQQNFDPWGRKRNHSTWTYTSISSVPTWLYRGFTGHESYDQFSLINMNARLYDPVTGRMLSPDIMVSMPYSSQGYNRYSYANNNPLKYIDPDGNEIVSAILIGAAIGVAMNGISNLIQDKNFFDGWLKSAVIGGLTGAISSGIGFLATGNKAIVSELAKASLADKAIFQGLMHGWSGAAITILQGGNPGQGFISGLTSSLTASSVQNIGGKNIATIIGGALSGGVGAAVVGGDFYEGAVFGLIASSLNHVAHGMKDLIQVDKANVYIKVTDEILLNDDGSIKTTKFTSLGVEYETPLYKAIISGVDINGNDVYLEVGVSRFGVKNGKINLPAKSGEHIAKYDVMKSNSNIKGLRIGETPYFIHEQWSYNDRNFGCLTMMGSSWDSFTSAISSAGHSSWGPSLNHTAIIKVTIVSAPYPIIKYP